MAMTEVEEPILLDATGKEMVEALNTIAEKISSADNKANKYTTDIKTLEASGWVGDEAPYTYDLGYDATVDIEILLPNTATQEEVDAAISAQICGNGSDNIIRAWGEVPTVDIPLVVRKVVK